MDAIEMKKKGSLMAAFSQPDDDDDDDDAIASKMVTKPRRQIQMIVTSDGILLVRTVPAQYDKSRRACSLFTLPLRWQRRRALGDQ